MRASRAVWRVSSFWRPSILTGRRPTWTPPRSSAASSSPSVSIVSFAANSQFPTPTHGSVLAVRTPRDLHKGGARCRNCKHSRQKLPPFRRQPYRSRFHSCSIADADPQSRLRRSRQLTGRGFRVAVARTPFEAIVKASCNLPDLILVDASLGEADAQETSDLLSRCPATAHIPIVRLSPGRRLPTASRRRRALTRHAIHCAVGADAVESAR